MKYLLVFIILLSIIITGCATHSSYDTAQFRNDEFVTGTITLQEGGLSKEQIESITSTVPPAEFPVDVAVIIITDGYRRSNAEQIFISKVIENLKGTQIIDRIVPIPDFLLTSTVSFTTIQELGVRTLCEYVIVFVIDSDKFFNWTMILRTEYEISSVIDFILVDSQTTAVLASDKLFSKTIYNNDLFKSGELEKAEEEIFGEQADILGEKIINLFK